MDLSMDVMQSKIRDNVENITNFSQKNKASFALILFSGALCLFNSFFKYDLKNFLAFGLIFLLFTFEDLNKRRDLLNVLLMLIIVIILKICLYLQNVMLI